MTASVARWLRPATRFFVMLFICANFGCSVPPFRLTYEPIHTAAKLATARSPSIRVDVFDKRPSNVVYAGLFSSEDYVPEGNLADIVAEDFGTELKDRGFVIGPNGWAVVVGLAFFQGAVIHTSFPGQFVTSIGMNVAIKRTDGSTAFDKFILGQSSAWLEAHPQSLHYRGSVMGAAIQGALAKVFSDSEFLDALRNS